MSSATVRRGFFLVGLLALLAPRSAHAQDGWINEFHYDNASTDVNEFVEVVIPSSFVGALSDYTVVHYNGDGGGIIRSADLSQFTAGTPSNGFTPYSFVFSSLQNGPDGLALCYQGAPVTSGSTVQFLSYEGTLAATAGCANGVTSTDVGVAETGSTGADASLQLQGTGTDYDNFVWAGPTTNTAGLVNTGQTFAPPTPTVSFVDATLEVSEGSQSTFDLDVVLDDPDGDAVTVDVVLTGGTATGPDFNNGTTVTVTFPAGAADGTVQTATFDLTDDDTVEGDETATFALQNVSAGAQIGAPSTVDVTIDDDDDVLVINEINADGNAGDANGDGVVGATPDEFVEIVNTSFASFDLGGFTLSDGADVRHVFEAGTVLDPLQAIVVFGGGTPSGDFGGSEIQTASGGGLSLNNTGDTVTLRDAVGNVVAEVTYGAAANDGQSITRAPDLTGSFVRHTVADGAAGAIYSPGTRVNGETFIDGGPPVVRFVTNRDVVSETAGTFLIGVQLFNPAGTPISVDVVFDASGSAESADVGGFTSQTVTFDGSPSNLSEVVTVTITDDVLEELDEEAVFTLENLSGDPDALLGNPDTFALTILDDDGPTYPNLVVNEYLYDPPPGDAGAGDSGDANNDGTRDTENDQFIEIVNTDAAPIDLSGFTISDVTEVRHVFPFGTVLQPNQAVVVFGGGDPQGAVFGGALVQTASKKVLSLASSNDEVLTLRDADGFRAARVTYNGDDDGADDQSFTRDPELSGPFAAHTTVQPDVEYSAGTFADGTPFGGGDPSAIITVAKGRRGWRMLSAPVGGYTVGDLAAQNLVQGLADEYPEGDPNVFQYDGSGFVLPAGEATALPSGTGFIWYLFNLAYDPADAGITNGESVSYPMPYMLQASGPAPATDVAVTLDNTPDAEGIRWELIGNPYDEAIDLSEITTDGTFASIGSVWDPSGTINAGSYVLTNDGDDALNRLAVWQSAFFENTDATTATIPAGARIGFGADFYGRPEGEARGRIGFSLFGPDAANGEPRTFDRNLMLYFDDAASPEWDTFDVSKLEPFGSTFATLAFVGERDGAERLKALESRPFSGETFEVPLAFEAAGIAGTFTLAWPRWTNIPDGWTMTLVDHEAGTEVDLREAEEYAFASVASRAAGSQGALAAPRARVIRRTGGARFTLRVERFTTGAEDAAGTPDTFALDSVYPNPSSAQATVTYTVPYATDVRLKVYDVLGREVATLGEGVAEAGRHTATFSAAGLASGVYLVRMVADGFAQTKRVVVTH